MPHGTEGGDVDLVRAHGDVPRLCNQGQDDDLFVPVLSRQNEVSHCCYKLVHYLFRAEPAGQPLTACTCYATVPREVVISKQHSRETAASVADGAGGGAGTVLEAAVVVSEPEPEPELPPPPIE